jgi:hypothetical protein
MGGLMSNPTSEAEAEQGDSALPEEMKKDISAIVFDIHTNSRTKYSFEFKMESSDRNFGSISAFRELMDQNGPTNELDLGYLRVRLASKKITSFSEPLSDISSAPLNRRALDTLYTALSSNSSSRLQSNGRPSGVALDFRLTLKTADEVHVLGLLFKLFMQYNLLLFPSAHLGEESVCSNTLFDFYSIYKMGTHRGEDLFVKENERNISATNKILEELSKKKRGSASRTTERLAERTTTTTATKKVEPPPPQQRPTRRDVVEDEDDYQEEDEEKLESTEEDRTNVTRNPRNEDEF